MIVKDAKVNNLELTSYKMSVMSSEIDCVARTCVVIECNGMGKVLLYRTNG